MPDEFTSHLDIRLTFEEMAALGYCIEAGQEHADEMHDSSMRTAIDGLFAKIWAANDRAARNPNG